MTAFATPFAQNADKRAPTASEKLNGFGCGAADLALFDFLLNRLEGNIKAVMTEAGTTASSEEDQTALVDAILALISAATGGNPAGYVLMTQARGRLPIFPEVLNTDGRIGVTAPSTGVVRLAGGVEFLHRGIFTVTTAQTDFNTDPSKTYHLRWNPTDGFVLRDLASGTYNPSTLAETNAAFDSAYDDMLVARIVTNSSNVATITTLANKAKLEASGGRTAPEAGSASNYVETLNWARSPRSALRTFELEAFVSATETPFRLTGAATRYNWTGNLLALSFDGATILSPTFFNAAFTMEFWA